MPTAMPEAPLASRFGKAPGQNRRLVVFLVIGRAEIDGVLIDAFEQQGRDIGHAGFGVTIGGRTVAVDVAEVPLPVDDRI